MTDYYRDQLSAVRLKRCYEIAPPRVRQYLRAEVEFVSRYISKADSVLELGCGYGRVLMELAQRVRMITGVDTSLGSLRLGRELLSAFDKVRLFRMNAMRLGFPDCTFDRVFCIQNGISAFRVEPYGLIRESLRVLKSGGIALFSSYSEKFWSDRLEWFRRQAAEGLLGEIDEAKTGNGRIVCRDGFTATTFTAEELLALAGDLDVHAEICEVDESSVFCVLQ